VIGGLAGAVGGASALPGNRDRLDASTDSEFRFLSAAWFAIAPLIWSILPDAERRPAQLRIVGGGIVLGGVARLRGWRRAGRPHPVMVAGAALELVGIPALLAWHTRVVRLVERGDQPASD
jgi:hypothetical protein